MESRRRRNNRVRRSGVRTDGAYYHVPRSLLRRIDPLNASVGALVASFAWGQRRLRRPDCMPRKDGRTDTFMEVVVRQSRGSSLAVFAVACSIAVACAGVAAGGQNGGGQGAGGHHGDNGGGNDGRGHGAGSHRSEGRSSGPQKGLGGDPNDPSSSSPVDDGETGAITTAVGTAPTASVVRSADGGQSLDLPPTLQPSSDSSNPSTASPIKALPGVPNKIVRACHDAVESAATPFGATRVRVSSAGFVHRLSQDTISAPIEVSIDYARQGRVETRQAPIKCELDATGSVIGLT